MAEETIEGIEEKTQKWLRGEISAQELYSLSPEMMEALGSYGYLLYQEGKYETAQIIFEGLCILDRTNPDFQKMLGSIYQIQHKWDAAYYRYTLALKSQPEDIFLLTNRGEALMALQRNQEAAQDLSQAVLLDQNNNHPAGRRARVLLARVNALK